MNKKLSTGTKVCFGIGAFGKDAVYAIVGTYLMMYLTDYRERTLKDFITQLEPGLFKKVSGLDVKDFELLVSLGVFNGALMNDAVYKFKRYEDSSLEYAGINKHQDENVGLFDTVLSKDDYIEAM